MSDINPIARPQRTTFEAVNKPSSTSSDSAATTRTSDRVELSEQARLLSKLKQLPDVREGLVNSVKSQIDSGKYDTDERFDTAVNALLDDLSS
ncbi:MAG: flagellar biosynthesis anti-sigma factor FlgM [Phycisphaeraceae bacterium]|nr:flagellar biosynthesis anti-sigma factor FlgM [Phycisphaeraceae bacterium]